MQKSDFCKKHTYFSPKNSGTKKITSEILTFFIEKIVSLVYSWKKFKRIDILGNK